MTRAMNIDREQALFSQCLEYPPSEWPRILAENCDDPELRERVLRLLERHRDAHTGDSSFLRIEGGDPDRIGPYRILQRLGEGGMGIVYAAEQREPVRRRVAIKVLRSGYNSREVLARFDVERQALALMSHVNIARIIDAGTTADHRPFIVMEFVPGEAITRYCERRDLPLMERLELFCTVCDAVQHAHQRGVIHRDLKPSNILIMEEDGGAVAKVIDFGIAKAISQRLTEQTLETKVGSLLGTPDYMSPEQANLSPLDVDTRSDVYALGAVLYQLLTGVPPLELSGSGKNYLEIQQEILDRVPPPPSSRVGGPLQRRVRGELDWITGKALEKQRNTRYASPADLAEDIRNHLVNGTVSAGPPSKLRAVDKFVRRHWLVTAAVLVVAVTLGVSQVVLLQKNRELQLARSHADTETEISRSVTTFLVDVFRSADPSRQSSRELSAREVLDNGVLQLEERLPDASPTRAALYRAIGNAYLNLGEYGAAERLLRRAHADAVQVHGPDHETALLDERSIGRAISSQGRLAEALEHFRKHAAHAEAVLGSNHAQTLRAYSAVATMLEQVGRAQESVDVLQDLQPRMREILGPDDPNTVYAMANFGSALDTLNRFEEALPVLEEAAAALERLHGPDHPYTMGVLFNVADTSTNLGRFDEAEKLHRDVLARHQRVLGPTHARTFASMRALAELLAAQDRLEEAFELMKSAYERQKTAEDVNEFIQLETQVGYARLVRMTGDAAEAERLLREAVASLLPLVGERHPLQVRAWRELALTALALDDHDAALSALTTARDAGLTLDSMDDPAWEVLESDVRFLDFMKTLSAEQ